MTEGVRVLLVDDHALLRDTLRDRLNQEAGIRVVGVAGDADEAVDLARELQPGLVVMDVDMPGMACFEGAKQIHAMCEGVKILYLSAFFNDRYIESALAAHASGYVTKDESPEVVVRAIRAVTGGRAYFSRSVRSRLVIEGKGRVRLMAGIATRASALTGREVEVLRYLARGMSKKQIAKIIGRSLSTVDKHTENLMSKLDIHDRVELARFAIREGLAEA